MMGVGGHKNPLQLNGAPKLEPLYPRLVSDVSSPVDESNQ